MACMATGVYFCERTGKRLVEPGVSKDVDPKNGKTEYGSKSDDMKAKRPAKGEGDK